MAVATLIMETWPQSGDDDSSCQVQLLHISTHNIYISTYLQRLSGPITAPSTAASCYSLKLISSAPTCSDGKCGVTDMTSTVLNCTWVVLPLCVSYKMSEAKLHPSQQIVISSQFYIISIFRHPRLCLWQPWTHQTDQLCIFRRFLVRSWQHASNNLVQFNISSGGSMGTMGKIIASLKTIFSQLGRFWAGEMNVYKKVCFVTKTSVSSVRLVGFYFFGNLTFSQI